MIFPLFMYNLKKNRFLWLALLGVMLFYHVTILMMYDPENIEAVNAMLDLFPKEMMQAIGFVSFGSTLLEFIVGYIYGFLIYLFPMILAVVINHRLVAMMVDRGSMAYVLSTPHTRRRVIVTQAVFSVVSMVLFFIVMSGAVILASELMFPNQLDQMMYIQINLYNIVQYLAIGALIFFGSSIANESNQSLAIGVGFPVVFLIVQMVANLGGDMEIFKYFTLFTLFSPESMMANDAFVVPAMISLAAIAVLLYGLSVLAFEKKNLYI
jgi:ABC-2 type transport system permease protein